MAVTKNLVDFTLETFNSLHDRLKFALEFGDDKINFLNTTIINNNNLIHRLGNHLLVTRHLCGARVRHPPVPGSFPSLGRSSLDASKNGSSTLTRRGKSSVGCGASQFERCECRVIYSCVLSWPPLFQSSRESGLMSNYLFT
ncbi:hypothetical protein ALC57_18525 [Trachymyrmex cornetzi]|uniref:Uncharacterized protein n=1 Tax=Trachymyrmex cornetzi TaxID=471704 RepID=A0A151IRR1_9HYME|nr:hypothetical protein ALC57_18525 [Trachymyrmex cornetzi]